MVLNQNRHMKRLRLFFICTIRLHTVDDFNTAPLLFEFFSHTSCFRKCLHTAMICDSNRRMPPFCGAFDIFADRRHRVHCGHFGVYI